MVDEVMVAEPGDGNVLLDFVPHRLGVPPRAKLRQLRSELTEGAAAAPRFLSRTGDDDEAETRRAVASCEYYGSDPETGLGAELLPELFGRLRAGYYARRLPRRLLDVATGQLRAAERVGDESARAEALNWIGIAHDLAGEPARAADAYRRALELDLSHDEGLRGVLAGNLALALARLGSLDEARTVFDDAIAALVAAGDRTEEARTRWNLAKTLLRAELPQQALDEARRALELAKEIDEPVAVRSIEATVAQAEQELDPAGTSAPAQPPLPVLDVPDEEAARELLGALALAEWDAGERTAARAHCEAAMAGYTARGDRLGVSRCLNNLAQFAGEEGDLEECSALMRRALDLRVILGDVDGQLLTLVNIARVEMHRDDYESAAGAAERALALAEDRLDEPAAFDAAHTLVVALLSAARPTVRCARRSAASRSALDRTRPGWKRCARCSSPWRRRHRRRHRRSLRRATRSTRSSRRRHRLAHLGDVAGTARVTSGCASDATETHTRGLLEGIRGIALQNAERHDEAADAYAQAAELLMAAGDAAQATDARQQRAVSLRRVGRIEESEQALREALEPARSADERETVAISLANTLNLRAEQTGRHGGMLRESRELMTPIAERSGNVLGRGMALVGLSTVDALEGDFDAALEHRRAGLGNLRRVNSPHVDSVEAWLRALEDEAAEHAADP